MLFCEQVPRCGSRVLPLLESQGNKQDHITALLYLYTEHMSERDGWAKIQSFLLWSPQSLGFGLLYIPLELAQENMSFSGCGQETRVAGEDTGVVMEKCLSLNTSQMLMFIFSWTDNPLCKSISPHNCSTLSVAPGGRWGS